MVPKRTTVPRIHQIGCRNVRQFYEFINLELLAAPGCFWLRSCRSLAIPGGSWPLLAALLAAPSRSWHVLAAFWRSFAVASASWRALAAPLAAFLIALLAALGSGRSWLRCWLRSWLRSWPLRNAHGAFLLRSWRSFAVAGYSWRFLAALLAAFLTTFLAASGGALRFPGGSWLFGSNWRYLFLASC